MQLPAAEAERLDALFRSTDDRKLRERVQIVLMAHRGRARQDIAADLGVHRKTVTRWITAYCDAGIDGLRPRKAKGKAGHIPRELADEVKRWVIEGPVEQGLDRANWTHEELADHLLKTKGIRTPPVRSNDSARELASACTGPRTGTCGGNPRSRPKPKRS